MPRRSTHRSHRKQSPRRKTLRYNLRCGVRYGCKMIPSRRLHHSASSTPPSGFRRGSARRECSMGGAECRGAPRHAQIGRTNRQSKGPTPAWQSAIRQRENIDCPTRGRARADRRWLPAPFVRRTVRDLSQTTNTSHPLTAIENPYRGHSWRRAARPSGSIAPSTTSPRAVSRFARS